MCIRDRRQIHQQNHVAIKTFLLIVSASPKNLSNAIISNQQLSSVCSDVLRKLYFICHFNSTTKKAKIKKWIKNIHSLHHDHQWNFLACVISQWSIGRRKYFSLSALFSLPHQNQAKEKVNEYFFASKVFVFLLHTNHQLSVIKPRVPPNHKLST